LDFANNHERTCSVTARRRSSLTTGAGQHQSASSKADYTMAMPGLGERDLRNSAAGSLLAGEVAMAVACRERLGRMASASFNSSIRRAAQPFTTAPMALVLLGSSAPGTSVFGQHVAFIAFVTAGPPGAGTLRKRTREPNPAEKRWHKEVKRSHAGGRTAGHGHKCSC
jgi:hypothetical protein